MSNIDKMTANEQLFTELTLEEGANVSGAQNITTKWACRLKHDGNKYVGDVSIWWGHKEGDAEWACNKWKSECGNKGGCWARRI